MKKINLLMLSLLMAAGSYAQSVGINASGTAPATGAMLDVEQTGTTSTSYGIIGSSTGAATTNYGGYFSATGATNNYGLVVPNGNVGIGTITPDQSTILDVNGSVIFRGVSMTAAGTAWGIYQSESSAKNYFSGNVGIGKTNPTVALDVTGAINASSTIYANGESHLYNGSYTDPTPGLAAALKISGGLSVNSISTSGKVGIGTTSPASPLHIKQSSNDYHGGLTLEESSNTTTWQIIAGDSDDHNLHFLYNGDPVAYIETNGNYGKGAGKKSNSNTINPTYDDEIIPQLTSTIQEQQSEIDALKKELDEIKEMLKTKR